jgi:hypothetical protein
MNCNFDKALYGIKDVVSIPNRDFDELQWREPESQAILSFQGAVARFKSNHSIREFFWKECQERLKAET